MDRETADKWCEWGILAVVLAILVFGPLATGAARTRDLLVIQGLTAVATALWVLRFWLKPSHRLQWTPICWPVLGFLIYAVFRYHQADVEYAARRELVRIVIYASLFLVVLNNLHRQDTTQLLTAVLLAVAMGISIYAIYQFITKSDYVWFTKKPVQYRGRGSGTFICPNHLAGFLEMLLPIALAHLYIGKASHVGRVLYGYVALVLMGGIAVSVSRGGWISTALSLLVFFGLLVRYRGYRRWALVSLLVISFGAFLFFQKARHPQKRFALMFTPGQLEDTSIRQNLWEPAWQMWKDHAWLGVGPGHFDVRFGAYRPPLVQARPYWVHNDYLNALTDWGVAGAALIAATLVCLALGVVKTWKFVHRGQNDLVTRRSDRAAHVLGLSVGLLALLCHSVVDFNMQLPANAILAIVLMASVTSHLRFATDNYWVTPHLLGRLLATVVCGVGIAFLSMTLVRAASEDKWLRAAAAASTRETQLEALVKAYVVEPKNDDTVYRIGETFRLESWEGAENYAALAREAMDWFELGMRLNPFEPHHAFRYAMCLDWLKQHAQAGVFFRHALALDPNSYYVVAMQGWHQMQLDDFPAAKVWFKRSLDLNWYNNSIATSYLEIVNRHLAEMGVKP